MLWLEAAASSGQGIVSFPSRKQIRDAYFGGFFGKLAAIRTLDDSMVFY
jgi:hypothetical protein